MKLKKVSKVLAGGLLVVSMAAAITGCGGNGSSDKGSGSANESTVKEEAKKGDTNGDEKKEDAKKESAEDTGMAKEIDFYAAVLKEEGCMTAAKGFEEETGIKVNVHSYDSADFVQAFMVSANGGSPIDVMLLNGQDVRYFMKNGLIQEMNGKPGADRVNDAAIQQYTYNGKLYAIGAKGGNSSGIYANMDVINQYGGKVPGTMQELVDLNDKLKADGLSLFAFGGGNKYMWPMWYFSCFGQTSGGRPVERTEEILTGKAKFTDADSIEAFEVLKTFAEDGMFQPGFNGTDSDGGKAVFVNGQSALYYGGTWEITSFLEAGMENVELHPFPIIKEGAKSIQTGNASDGAYTIYSKIDPARQSAAEAFIEYMTREEVIQGFRTSESQDLRDYSRSSCNKNVPLPDDADDMTKTQQVFLETMTFTHPDWIYPPEITTALQDTLQALTGLQITPEEAGQQMQAVMDELLADGYDYNEVEQKQ